LAQEVNATEISDQWPIDQAVLTHLLGPRAAVEMLQHLPFFFEVSTPQVEKLLLAAERLDCQEMALMAHTLRGSSANLAMTSLTKLCLAIEQHCRAGRIDEAITQVKALKGEYTRIQQAYHASL
jgi:HPt (histidine-containing phosphotransfer) domain-containing protein